MGFLKPNIPRQAPMLAPIAPIMDPENKGTVETYPLDVFQQQKKKASLGTKGLLVAPPILNPL